MKFKYDEISVFGDCIAKTYKFGYYTSHSLISILNLIGESGWDFVGKIEGKLIVKKAL